MSAMNIPNEPGSWDSDFSYSYLTRLYAVLGRDFTPALVGDASDRGPPEGSPRRVFIRHDIDVSLERAVPIARLEKDRAWSRPTT